MKWRNFWEYNTCGIAIAPQRDAVGAYTQTGATITEPWRIGRAITFLYAHKPAGALTTPIVKVQGLKRSDGTTWEDIVDKGGSVALQFTVAKLADANLAETAGLVGTIPCSRLNATTYKAIRLLGSGTGAADQVAAAFYVINGLYTLDLVQVDDLWTKMMP